MTETTPTRAEYSRRTSDQGNYTIACGFILHTKRVRIHTSEHIKIK